MVLTLIGVEILKILIGLADGKTVIWLHYSD